MKIIHTADWHLGKWLGRIDRSEDLRRAVGRIIDICMERDADVLLICGDLFDDISRVDVLRSWLEYLNEKLRPFLERGGTVLTITGNHDSENFAHVLQRAMSLAAPMGAKAGGVIQSGRFYLFSGPTFFRLAGRDGTEAQFVMMPWPTEARYLDEQGQRFKSREQKNATLKAAFVRRLDGILNHADFDKRLPTVLAAHICTSGAQVRGNNLGEGQTVVLPEASLPTGFAYVALGDIHCGQCLLGLSHVRYSGSIERLDLGEAEDAKGVILVEVGPRGRAAEPMVIGLESATIRRIRIDDPSTQLAALVQQHPDHQTALVSLEVCYLPGRDNIIDLQAELERVFPNWYSREWIELGDARRGNTGAPEAGAPAGVAETVRKFLGEQLADDPQREQVLALAESLLVEQGEA